MNEIIITEKTFEKIRNKVKENKDKKIIFTSNDDELNRKVLEKLEITTLLLNEAERKDKPKERNSGLNQVLAKIAKKNEIKIGINLDEIIEAKKLQKAKILARVKQNILLCNKEKIEMEFYSKKESDSYDLKSLGLVLGMPTWMTKNL